MKPYALLPTFLLISSGVALAESVTSPEILTRAEAEAIVLQEVEARANREAEAKARLESVPALEVFTVSEGNRRIIMRRVAPRTTARIQRESGASVETEATGEEQQPVPPSALPHLNFTLFVTLFDQEFTEIRCNYLENEYTVLSNSSLSFLPAIKTFEREKAAFSFFSFIEHVDTETETARPRPDPAVFTGSAPEYIVYAEADAPHSEDFLEAIDLLHRHYLEKKADYEAQAQRAAALHAARDRLEKPKPKETVINYSPVYSSKAK